MQHIVVSPAAHRKKGSAAMSENRPLQQTLFPLFRFSTVKIVLRHRLA